MAAAAEQRRDVENVGRAAVGADQLGVRIHELAIGVEDGWFLVEAEQAAEESGDPQHDDHSEDDLVGVHINGELRVENCDWAVFHVERVGELEELGNRSEGAHPS